MIQKHVRKLISMLLVIALMSSCLGIGSVSVSAASNPVVKRGLCISGWHNVTDPSITKGEKAYEPRFYHNIEAMNYVFNYNLGADSEWWINNTKDANEVLKKIRTTFQNADSNDINYLYLTGHGTKDAKCMNVGGTLYYTNLRHELDKLYRNGNHGHFYIFIQTCYSGQAIGSQKNGDSSDAASDDEISEGQAILEEFFGTTDASSSTLADSKNFTVFCSSRDYQSSAAQKWYGRATYAWTEGLGYRMNANKMGGSSCDRLADKNKDNIITVEELNDYAVKYMKTCGISDRPCYYSSYFFRTLYTKDRQLGDPDMDKQLTNKDVLMIRKHIAGTNKLSGRALELANVDGSTEMKNGKEVITITSKDYLCLQKHIAGMVVQR